MMEQRTAGVDPICIEEGCGGVMRPTGTARMSYPSQDEFVCPKCGVRRYLRGLVNVPLRPVD